jgi:hypothetical protein
VCAFLLFQKIAKRYIMLFAEVPCWLQSVESANGRNLMTCVQEQGRIPLLAGLRAQFKNNIDLSGGDRGSGVVKMDRLMADHLPHIARCGLGCQVHSLHTVQKKLSCWKAKPYQV